MRRMMRNILWLMGALCIFLLAAFAIANRGIVTLNLWPLPFATTMPLFASILGAFAFGLLVGAGVTALSRQRLKIQARSLERRAERAERAAAEQKAAMADQTQRPVALLNRS